MKHGKIKLGRIASGYEGHILARHWRNDPRIYRWCRQHDLISASKQEQWLDRIETDPTIEMFRAGDNGSKDEDMVGVVGLTSIDMVHRNAEFSLYIAPEYQGHGYAADALIAICKFGFYHLGLKRIWGDCFDGNDAATHVYKKVGFMTEGMKRCAYFKHGKWINSYIVSMLDNEFSELYPHEEPVEVVNVDK